MAKTLKLLLDQVCAEIGFDVPGIYFNSTDENIRQMVAITNRSAIRLRDLHLQKMVRIASITLSGGTSVSWSPEVQSYPLPADFLALVPDTTYQQGRIDMVDFPTSPTLWNYLISRSGPEGLRIRCRIEDGRLYVFSPDVAETMKFEYLSKFPIQGAVSGIRERVPKEQFDADDDTWLLDDPLIELDVIWRYKKAKGLDWEMDRGDYQLYENALRARDRGAKTIAWPCGEPYPNAPFTNLWVS